jgi:ABC-type multidrug transport system fused ATPase/permease subunit
LFKALPNYVVIPSIPTLFITSALFLTSKKENDPVFLMVNFFRYYLTVQKLNSEINKLIDSLMTLEELSSNLVIVNQSVKILNLDSVNFPVALRGKKPFENGDIVFQNVIFAYPKRPQQNILKDFSFRFEQGKIYGIAGKNGIGKSTITKTTLKLYELKEGKILINNRNIQEIDTASLHQRICYQTNRPTFFRMSIAENVLYPHQYKVKEH